MADEIPPDVVDAIAHFQSRAEKTIRANNLIEDRQVLGKLDFGDVSSVEERAKRYIQVADARYAAGQMSEHEHLFHRCYAIENLVHEARWMNHRYDEDLRPISEEMRKIEEEWGLGPDEYWPIGDAPEAYQALSRQYDRVLEAKLEEAFIEFGAADLQRLYSAEREKFDQLVELGRKSVFLREERTRLQELVAVYERDAARSEGGEAYLAASIMLASAIEGRLLVACLTDQDKVRSALSRMGLTNSKLKSKNPVGWKLETLIDVCAECGWIPDVKTEQFIFSGKGIAHLLRAIRNQVHPHVQIKKRTGLGLGREQFKDVKAAHQFLSSTLPWPNNSLNSTGFSAGAPKPAS